MQTKLLSWAASGGTRNALTKGMIESFEVLAPSDIFEQSAIAHILGALDDKIELNRRMNDTLEAIARALFKSWFVDFDPVCARAEGRDPGLPKEIADLFPDRLEESELGEIPAEWEVRTLGDVSDKAQYGYTASANREPIGPKFLRITDINKRPWIDWSTVPHCKITDEDLHKYRLSDGDILIARMADPGHGVLIEECLNAVFASYLIRLRPLDSRYRRYLQYWLRSDSYWELVAARASGTTRVTLNAKALAGFQLVIPQASVAEEFSTLISSLRLKVVENVKEMETLTALRDTVLPKLISGELRVKKATAESSDG